ncbi:MAG TPA: hypothetical protein VJV75_08890 [Candidatus Polarisedimenticolia bacterium]|nr:hypothetical protein [Candidatus Polarisedimenticolia bacterium]
MPIDYVIDHDHRLVRARGSGIFTDEDVFNYQKTVWSRDDVRGYDEVLDMTDVRHIALPSFGRIRDVANLSVTKDDPKRVTKFAIVAPGDVAYMLGKLYKAIRSATSGSTRKVGVFRTADEAMAFLKLGESREASSQNRG